MQQKVNEDGAIGAELSLIHHSYEENQIIGVIRFSLKSRLGDFVLLWATEPNWVEVKLWVPPLPLQPLWLIDILGTFSPAPIPCSPKYESKLLLIRGRSKLIGIKRIHFNLLILNECSAL